MIFAAFALDDADGVVLAHSHRLPGRVLKKGLVLDAEALTALPPVGGGEIDGAQAAALSAQRSRCSSSPCGVAAWPRAAWPFRWSASRRSAQLARPGGRRCGIT